MGEIAEMMLDGTLCAGCGTFMDTDGDGIPAYCSKQCALNCGEVFGDSKPKKSSARADKAARINRERQEAAGPKPFHCVRCARRFRYGTALAQHERDKHGGVLLDVPAL
jgi:hypothetical protein